MDATDLIKSLTLSPLQGRVQLNKSKVHPIFDEAYQDLDKNRH